MAAAVVTATVRNGALRGTSGNGALSFKGIPYGDTTAGANRFKAPQPVRDWTGERDATRYGALSPQINTGMSEPIFGWYNQREPQGEDCLVLNVFTPDLDTQAKRPVMFYIHGGGYINGGGGGAGLDGSNLARYGDVVVVTINHRLNAFGYTNLSHLDPENFGDASNAGNLDIVAALEWVRDNIAVFGGDRSSVTVFGQSGGGSKIMTLLAMPKAQGLFHRAISMSGAAGLNVDPAADMEPYVNALIKELGVDPKDLAALQQIPAQVVLDARSRAVASSFEGARPVIDGKHIVTRPMTPEGLAMHAKVPLMMGSTKTEASLFFQSDMRNFNLEEKQTRARLRTAYKIGDAKVDAIMSAYRKASPEMTPSDILVAVASDVQFRLPLTGAAEVRSGAAGQAPVYMYNFGWTIPWENGVLGSPHAVDIPFAFGTVNEAGAMTGGGDAAMETSMNMMSAFVSFARTGNPNNDRMPEWRPYDSDTRTTMLINETCEAASDWRGDGLREVSDLKIDPFNRAALYQYHD
ncbi:carboxylesterase/lipase family protein [Rhizobium leguminosarum]|uniref:carboxylesterase/lipase family protein n=1 Tax=Rhizobium leguminosarum TaxID=384 RepID=UPI001C98B9BF|nr:carboxylesterase family protein [Rhizobium leguminosarum]MBY5591587.1 carboxylesterase/lipase family protein [Rhizobium leguminosarum]MBY5605423.1 carboxylesterase/lipase family protein [Rhizobium leguminosarum]